MNAGIINFESKRNLGGFNRIIFTSVINNYISTADTCKNCPKCGKGFKIGTKEGYDIKIKIRLGGISKFSAFVLTPTWLPQTKAFH